MGIFVHILSSRNNMNYQEIFHTMLNTFRIYYHQVMHGDFSQVCYLEGQDPVYGTYDLHYPDRLKLCYYLLYNKETEVPEQVLVRLFEEELTERETNSFQGIGEALEILTALLLPYNTDNQYQSLFERAKNANFDCWCGYEPEHYLSISRDFSELDLISCIMTAYTFHETETALQFLDIWKSQVLVWNKDNCNFLIQRNKELGRLSENEIPLRLILKYSLAEQDTDAVISARNDILTFLIEQNRPEEACTEFFLLQKMELSSWYGTNLFLQILENCMDIILADLPEAEMLWKWAMPHLKRELRNSFALYPKTILAARKMQPGFARKAELKFAVWKIWKKE